MDHWRNHLLILIESKASMFNLLHKERQWRKENNQTHKSLNYGDPRIFEFSSSKELPLSDYVRQYIKVASPVQQQRSLRSGLMNLPYFKDVPKNKVLDVAKEKMISSVPGIYRFKRQLELKNPFRSLQPDSRPIGASDLPSNTIGMMNKADAKKYSLSLMPGAPDDLIDVDKLYDSAKKHEGEHIKQAQTARKLYGNKAAETIQTNYLSGVNVPLDKSIKVPDGVPSKMYPYLAHPFEHQANIVGSGSGTVTPKQREEAVRQTYNNNSLTNYIKNNGPNAIEMYKNLQIQGINPAYHHLIKK